MPSPPSQQERELHELTHLPFRSWCPICTQAKARQDVHRRSTQKSLPVIQVGYAFVSSAADGLEATVLTAIDTITGMSLATIVTSKGYNAHAIAELRRFVYEMGRTSGILQSDQELAIRVVLRSVIMDIGGLSMRSSPI